MLLRHGFFGSFRFLFQSFRELVVPPSTKVQAELSIRKPHDPRVTFCSSRKNSGKCRSHRCHRHDTTESLMFHDRFCKKVLMLDFKLSSRL